MIVIASANGAVGLDAAWAVLSDGGSALDAVQAAIRLVEDNPADHSVGYGGYPNVLGEVELDASIMDGATREAGAVGGLRGYRAAISVARAVMERLPHALVVGEGAARLAAEIGLPPESLLTAEAEQVWREGRERRLADRSEASLIDQVQAVVGETYDGKLARSILAEMPPPGGTVNVLALDRAGHLASGVSTSGWPWKYPGRLGDSPVIGAGNYCDDRYGAVACTGWGELTIRAGTARAAVAELAAGRPLAEAGQRALADVAALKSDELARRGHVSLVALDPAGGHFAATTKPGAEYVWRADGMAATERAERTLVSR